MLRGLVLTICLVAVAATPAAPPLPFFYDLYTFRGDEGATTVVASFAVPAGRLDRESEDGEVRYRFDVSFVLADTVGHFVSRTDDSVYVSLPDALSGDHLFHTHVEVQAPPSTDTWQRVIMTDATSAGTGQIYYSSFPIPDYGGDELMLSDIALGMPGARSGWRRGDVTLALLPTSQFPESAFDVYYEIYNLPAGDSYDTEFAFEPVDEAGAPLDEDEGRAVRARFSGESSAGEDASVQELRRVQSALEKGHYRLTVTVTNRATGEAANRSRFFEVRGWGRGATLVQALPRRGGGS